MSDANKDGGSEDHRLVTMLLSDVKDVKVSIENINKSLIKLTQLEVEHLETRTALGRAFSEIKEVHVDVAKLLRSQDERIRIIEVEMPGLKEVRKWVIGMAIGCVALMFLALAKLVLVEARPIAVIPQQGAPSGR